MRLVTAQQMQEMDAFTINEFGIPGLVLMENAGKGAFDLFMERYHPDNRRKVAVVAGRGNNGGDGWVIARYLMGKKIPVTVFLLSQKERVANDARVNMELVEKLLPHATPSKIVEIPDADALERARPDLIHHTHFVDAIFGTGLNSDVRGFYKDVIGLMNETNKPVFSVDIPSGLNADTGQVCGIAVKADATATFAFAKAGHVLYPGNRYTGDLDIVNIGIPGPARHGRGLNLELLEPSDIAALFPERAFDSHKGSFGHLLVLAGSAGKTGAAALCANAAVRMGTGLVTLGAPRSVNASLEPMVIEPMTVPLPETRDSGLSLAGLEQILNLAQGKQVLALGPGLGTAPSTRDLVRTLVSACPLPLILDADGINCMASNPGILKTRKIPAVLTPHPGEMARLCGTGTAEIQADRIGSARQFAGSYQCILVLKGAQTLIACPDGRVFVCPTGNPGMATGGMGDVLTGMIAGLCAQGFSPENAALAGVFLHGLCGDLLARKTGGFGYVASDMVRTIPLAVHRGMK